ncbi:hypothetical protein [Paraliobacillus sediminis]|uniref:hypothetical protein n=1 Tax=Paraliobacillus sediminis TaxID=1885916 RepID=UPI0013C2CDF9|nr:hypothetical protein [Paraliobacillus sediminis]
MNQPINKSIDSIIVTRKRSGEIVDAETGNELIASISNEEIIMHDDYEIKIVPAKEN